MKKTTSKKFFKQIAKERKIANKVFALWENGKTLEIPPRLLNIAKVLGKEYFGATGRTAKIKVI